MMLHIHRSRFPQVLPTSHFQVASFLETLSHPIWLRFVFKRFERSLEIQVLFSIFASLRLCERV